MARKIHEKIKIHVVAKIPHPLHLVAGEYNQYGSWVPKPEYNPMNILGSSAYGGEWNIFASKQKIRVFYSLNYAKLLASTNPVAYRNLLQLPADTLLFSTRAEIEAVKRVGTAKEEIFAEAKMLRKIAVENKLKKRKNLEKLQKAGQHPKLGRDKKYKKRNEHRKWRYIQVSAPFSTTKRWFTVVRVKDDAKATERYVARLKVPEGGRGELRGTPKPCIRHVRVVNYDAAVRVFRDETNAIHFLDRCVLEIKGGFTLNEAPRYLCRETGEEKIVDTMHPDRLMYELNRIEQQEDIRSERPLPTDEVVPMINTRETKTINLKEIPEDLYDMIKMVSAQEGLSMSSWIRSAIETHLDSMRYKELAVDKELFPNVDFEDDDTPPGGRSARSVSETGGIRTVFDF